MPGRNRVPSFQLASGTTNERDNSYNLNTLGSIFYNTDTSNVEVYHEDPSNTLGWRDLVMNNKEQIDISGKLVVAMDASFQNNVDISGSLMVNGIPTSGGGGDVTLAGNPNAFSGTNTFDVNRPTSTLTSTPAATEFITKANGDALYGGVDTVLAGGTTANPQIFTGVNKFDGTTNANVGLIEQTASHNNSFIQTSGVQTNFIRQNGTTKGFIVQEGDDSAIRQDGENAEIKQTGDNADFRQQGDGCGIRQSGQYAIINQTGLNSVISSPRVRCNNLPVIGNDLCNKTYVDSLAGGTSAFVYNNDAYGDYSSAFGYNNDASGDYSSAFGYNNDASGANSVAIGYKAKASGGKMYFGIEGCEAAVDQIYFDNSGGKMRLNTPTDIICNGNVGIGTTIPDKGRLHVNGSVANYMTARYYNKDGNIGMYTANRAMSAYFSHQIACEELQVYSDQRIKENIVEIDDGASLQKVRDISCVWYNYKDKVSRGNSRVAGFLAQQVKEHLPEAVSIMRDFIPNEMKKLNVTWDNSNKMISELKDVSGVKYRFYVSNDISGNNEIMKDVVGNEDNTFTFDASYNNVFCYGKEIDDFHTLHKSKLFAINFSAIQELDRNVTKLENKINSLEARIETLKTENIELKTDISLIKTENTEQKGQIIQLTTDISMIRNHIGI